MVLSRSLTAVTCALALLIETSSDSGTDMIAWVRSKGGSVSEKLEIRRIDPSDEQSYFGVFAKTDIDAKESLLNIPRECYIHIFDEAEPIDVENPYPSYHRNLCKMAHKLQHEMELGEASEFAPYIAYLKTQKISQLPANWSKAGKDVLRKIATPGSEIVDWIDWNFKNKCIQDDPIELHMIEMTIQRGYDTAFIPIWDMVNHDNGRINTENSSMHDEEGLKVTAARDIKAGEEIFATYDMCVDCNEVSSYWGTPEILKDFGFVEPYPHRWVFYDEGIWFEVHKDDELAGGELEAIFGDDENVDDVYGVPNHEQIQFLQKELDRLNEVGQVILNDQGNVPDREWHIIHDFYMAAVTDIHTAIEEVAYINSLAVGNNDL